MNINNYFNEKSRSQAWNTILGVATTGLLLNSNSAPVVTLGIVMAAYSLGQINMWQQAATGKPLWKPKIDVFGL